MLHQLADREGEQEKEEAGCFWKLFSLYLQPLLAASTSSTCRQLWRGPDH